MSDETETGPFLTMTTMMIMLMMTTMMEMLIVLKMEIKDSTCGKLEAVVLCSPVRALVLLCT